MGQGCLRDMLTGYQLPMENAVGATSRQRPDRPECGGILSTLDMTALRFSTRVTANQ
jgi:hypothetical protein